MGGSSDLKIIFVRLFPLVVLICNFCALLSHHYPVNVTSFQTLRQQNSNHSLLFFFCESYQWSIHIERVTVSSLRKNNENQLGANEGSPTFSPQQALLALKTSLFNIPILN
jgi:hypothetical protein